MSKRRGLPVKRSELHPIRVEYVPPTDAEIEHYAHQLCERLAAHDPAFAHFEIRNGLSGFLKLVAALSAKQKNKKLLEENVLETDESLDSRK